MGRPKGAKDRRPRVVPSDIERAKMMFIAGARIQEIKKTFGFTSTNLIYRHIEKGGWEELREKYLQEREKNYLGIMMEKSIRETDKILGDLTTIKEKAMEIIPRIDAEKTRFGEAVSSYVGATELERRVRSEGVELGFIQIVAKVLKDTVQDPKLLAQIAEQLKIELSTYRGRPLLQSPKVTIVEE